MKPDTSRAPKKCHPCDWEKVSPVYLKPRAGSRRGVAILVVLSITALMTVILLSMLTMSAQHRTEAMGSVQTVQVEQVAHSAVQIALAQLREATSQSLGSGDPAPWTSQPGAVRVHGMDGSLQKLYKLYTSHEMLTRNEPELREEAPQDWSTAPEEFVDLNAPLITDHAGGKKALRFPIVDPRAMTANPTKSVEGFSYETRQAPGGTVGPLNGEDAQRLPMPVRWVYQLEDGTMGTVDRAGNFTGFDGGVATKHNRIAARFAFWTDDESCKINVNTAGEGVFWDTPRADTPQERALAQYQPTRAEYHRQPGHPAGVSLSSVLLPGQRFHATEFPGGAMSSMSADDAKALWSLARLGCAEEAGTSRGGTQTPGIALNASEAATSGLPLHGPYGGLGELLLERAAQRSGARRSNELFRRHPEAVARLARGGFFLTTQSAAPETTLFGTPRIALWPVHGNTDLTTQDQAAPIQRSTEYDYAIARTATLAGRKYYVQRLRPADGAWDLQRANGGENFALFHYLRDLTRRPFPGWLRENEGFTSFANKYGPDHESILLGMMDYIRAANFSDGQLAANIQFPVSCPGNAHEGFGQVTPLSTPAKTKAIGRMMTVSEVALFFVCRAEVGEDGVLKGEPTAQHRSQLQQPGDREIEVALLVEAFVPSHGWADYKPYVSFALTGGPRGAEPDVTAPFPEMQLNVAPLRPSRDGTFAASSADAPREWAAWGGAAGVRALTERVITFQPVFIPQSEAKDNKLHFSGSWLNADRQLKLAIYDDPGSASSGRAGQGDLVQVIPLEIPDIGVLTPHEVPLPSLPADGLAFTIEKRLREARRGGRLLSAGDVVQSMVPAHGDYRLLAAQRRAEAPAESTDENAAHPAFVTHPLWGRARFAHSLREPTPEAREKVLGLSKDTASPDNPDSHGFISGLALSPAHTPDAPIRPADETQTAWALVNRETREVSAAALCDWTRLDGGKRGPARPDITGDFDNGLGNAPDGAYINRPDDGNLLPLKTGGLPYFTMPQENPREVPPVSADVFSPYRLFPSAIAFGSLPTGAVSQVPWQTLLFRPQPAHYGAQTPPDHLLLDLFWTPVIEPEPHSRALETAGKINLNHQLVPFSYIHRATALHAAMKLETLTAIPDTAAAEYKSGSREHFRHFIDAAATLRLWHESVFAKGRVFLTPGEICAHYLVPEGAGLRTRDDLAKFWSTHRLTGDNSKERPYAHLYPRLTTRSNVFRVHYLAETIQVNRIGNAARLDLTTDTITARRRGSCLIRRELDTTDKNIPDYAVKTTGRPPLDAYYEWRISEWRDER